MLHEEALTRLHELAPTTLCLVAPAVLHVVALWSGPCYAAWGGPITLPKRWTNKKRMSQEPRYKRWGDWGELLIISRWMSCL